MKRRDLLKNAIYAGVGLIGADMLAAKGVLASGSPVLTVAKTPECGCCEGWIAHVEAAGFKVKAHNTSYEELSKLKAVLGVPENMASCHTAQVEGYVIEGHVPASDIKKLLETQPAAIGIAVPGMPLGSPGMDFGDEKEPYETLLFAADGSSSVFARR